MTIQQLHMENNALRDLIAKHKEAIAKADRAIRVNEEEISKLIQKHETFNDCVTCLGECNTNGE